MTNRYQILIEREPRRILRRLPRPILERIQTSILSLADDPRPPGCIKPSGHQDLWRVRVGDWRITYAVLDGELVVLIVEISPRGGAYRILEKEPFGRSACWKKPLVTDRS